MAQTYNERPSYTTIHKQIWGLIHRSYSSVIIIISLLHSPPLLLQQTCLLRNKGSAFVLQHLCIISTTTQISSSHGNTYTHDFPTVLSDNARWHTPALRPLTLHTPTPVAATIVLSAILARSAVLALSRWPLLLATFALLETHTLLASSWPSRTLHSLAVRCSLSDGLTLSAHLTVVAPSVTGWFLLQAYRLPLWSSSFDRASSSCVLTLPSAAHCFVGPAADWRAVDPTAATKCNGPRPYTLPTLRVRPQSITMWTFKLHEIFYDMWPEVNKQKQAYTHTCTMQFR